MTEKRLESLDMNLLLALHWLLTERNVTAAASRLGLSQPAASRALGRLREIFGDPILVKSGGEMAPTRMAEKLQPVVALAVERMRDVLKITDSFEPENQTGRFRIACTDYVGVMIASAWIKSVSRIAPKLDLDLINLTTEVSRELVSGKIDLVIVPELRLLDLPAGIDVDQFVHRDILRQEYVCAVRKGHPLAKGKMTLKRFVSVDHILVTPSGARIGIVDQTLSAMELERRIAYRTSSFLLALPILQKTDCIITAPDGLLEPDASNLVMFPPPIELKGYTMLGAWHPNWTHDERHKWVREKLFAALGAHKSSSE